MAENKIEKTRQIYLNREVSTVFDDENFYAHNKTVRLSNIIVSLDLFFTAIPGFELTNIERDGKEIDAKNFLSEEAFDDADENEKYLFKNAILTHQIDLTGFKCEVQSHSDSDGTPIQIFVWVDMTENDLSVLIQKFKEAQINFTFKQLKNMEAIKEHTPLQEVQNGLVSQHEHTVAVVDGEIIVLTQS